MQRSPILIMEVWNNSQNNILQTFLSANMMYLLSHTIGTCTKFWIILPSLLVFLWILSMKIFDLDHFIVVYPIERKNYSFACSFFIVTACRQTISNRLIMILFWDVYWNIPFSKYFDWMSYKLLLRTSTELWPKDFKLYFGFSVYKEPFDNSSIGKIGKKIAWKTFSTSYPSIVTGNRHPVSCTPILSWKESRRKFFNSLHLPLQSLGFPLS